MHVFKPFAGHDEKLFPAQHQIKGDSPRQGIARQLARHQYPAVEQVIRLVELLQLPLPLGIVGWTECRRA